MRKVFREFTEEKLEQIRSHPYFKEAVDIIRARAEKCLTTEPPRVKFSQIHLFVTTGNRSVFEAVHSEYQRRLEDYFFMYLIDRDDKYLEPLADIIWNICDFESWSIPACVAEELEPERRKRNLDLTSTIYGSRLSEVLYYIGDKLPELVVKRAKYEIRYRIIDSYKMYTEKDFWWMTARNNWSAVCTAATFNAFLYAAEKEEIEEQLPRMIRSMEYYLEGFDDEGCCLEGYTYWHYGFSHFCMFASMLRDYTDGEKDWFKEEKVHKIALFQQDMSITSGKSVSFSDCGNAGFYPTSWLSHFLKREYDDIEIPPLSPNGRCSALRYLVWSDPQYADCEMHPKSRIFENAQWFISRKEKYNFACKAGSNAEMHNQNDVGSFIIAKNDKVTFTDPGGGDYTRQYFSTGERYKILACSSRGHSVPIINGQYQLVGEGKSTIFDEELDKRYCFNMELAYRIPSLVSLKRSFVCDDDGVTMTDEYEFSEMPTSVVERFVSLTEPSIYSMGTVICGDCTMTYDPQALEASISSEPLARRGGAIETVWMVDLAVRIPDKDMKITVKFE